jgi:phospholipase A1/A2
MPKAPLRSYLQAAACLIAGLLAHPLAAQPGVQGPAAPVTDVRVTDCARIGDDAQRLACYDRVAGRLLPPPAASGTMPTPDLESLLPVGAGPLARAVVDVRRSLGTTLGDRWELDPSADRGRFLLRPYKPMYVMIGEWSSDRNELPVSPNPNNVADVRLSTRRTEAKFQLSLKTKVWEDLLGGNGDLWLAYTQTSYWQVYDSAASRPFRESNYEPEVMAMFRTNYRLLGWDGRLAGLALNHQSNGRSEPLSRSWNRLIGQIGLERKNWMVMLRPWWRIPESSRTDDNPDIEDFMGRADLLVVRKSEGHELSFMARHSLRSGSRSRGAMQIDYAFPITSYLKAYVQIFSGYGASLIDYNHRQERLGVGISLIQWL